MIKKILMRGMSTLMAFTLGACGNGEPSAEGNTGVDSSLENVTESISKAPDGESSESNNENTDIDSESTVLIAYFSWSGNTKQLAEMIQEQMGGKLFEIEPETPYTDDINELSGISLQEQHDNIRPALSSAAPDMSQYDVIFVGFPNWWNNMPMPVFTFLEGYDFSGKTVIPFTTYGNGVWGKSVDSIRDTVPDAIIVDGLAIQEHELQDAYSEVSEWLQGLGLIRQVDGMRAKIKIVIDTGMIILVLLQMAYHLIGDSLHEWLGIMLFVLLILHNILDRKWYL